MSPGEETVSRIGRYEIVRKIATGGMAELFLGKYTGPGGFEKRCALKRILPQFAADPTFQRMFQNEARVSAMFDHPNVVQVFELGEDHGQFFIAMELVNGVNLRQLMQMAREANQRIPPELAAHMITQALDGLAYAHAFRDPDTGVALDLVHRDISPQNILVSYDGAVKLVDFGIVKGSSISGETQTGMLKGKAAYMSPEQAAGDPIDARADLFSLGVCFYELIAGQRPFQGQTDIMVLKAILDAPPIPITQFVPDLAEGLEQTIHRALSKFPAQRHASAREQQLELQQILRDCPTPLGRHVVADYIRSLTESTTVTFDATALRIPRRARSAGFAHAIEPRPGTPASSGGYAPQTPSPLPAYVNASPPAQAWASPPGPGQPVPGAVDYASPPPHEADARTPMPLDESVGGTAEMLRQAGLQTSKRSPGAWALFALSVILGAGAVALVLSRSSSTPAVVAPMGRVVDVVELPPSAPSSPTAPTEPAAAPSEPIAEAPAEPPTEAAPERAAPPEAKPTPSPERKKRRRRRRKPAEVKAPAPAAAPSGRVSVSSIPAGLSVLLDGDVLGKTPLETKLPPGPHELVLKSSRLGIRRKVSVDVHAGGIASAKVQVGRGTLKVVSRPWAEVFVNGEHVGKTPLTVPQFEGRQTVKLVTEDKRERIQRVQVHADQEALVRVKF